MRVIDLGAGEVRTVAVSPDGRFVAASGTGGWNAVYDWVTGETVRRLPPGASCGQFAFGPGNVVWYVQHDTLRFDRLEDAPLPPESPGSFAGGVAASPDGKILAAARNGPANRAQLALWSMPAMRPQKGFDYWSPFRRLAFSPNGHFLAGIYPGLRDEWPRDESAAFELRFAASGGLDYRHRFPGQDTFDAIGFISYTRDSALCAFGWEDEFYVRDISTGTSREVCRVEAQFRDAAFTGSGGHFATVTSTGLLKLWDRGTWRVAREYDWRCGPLTCLAFTADGSAGVCGTADGQLVQFDVDE